MPRAVCTFVEDCLHYAADADLEASYATVRHEQTDAEVSLYRTLEALQGFDAGYGNEDRLQFLVRTAKVYDPETIRELSRFLYDCPELEDEMQAVKKGILGCKIDIGSLDMNAVQIDATAKPWEVGFSLARQVRCQWNLNGPVTNEALCERVSLRAEELDCADRDSAVGFGARMSDAVFSLKFAKRSRTSSRFMFTRGICDAIVSRKGFSNFLAITPSKTARRKIQRAFAAELLCPIDDIVQETNNVSDKDAIDYLAEKYAVSTRVVESQLSTHGYGQLPSVA